MDRETAKRIVNIQERAMADAAYQQLLEEYAVSKAWFGAFLETLTQEQQSAAADYLGVTAAMYLRLLELAVTLQ